MLLSGWLAQINLAGLDFDIIFPDEIYAEIPAPVVIKVRNNKRFFPSFFLSTSIYGKGVRIDFLPPKSTLSKNVMITFAYRGKVKEIVLKTNSSFPFNFFERYNKTLIEDVLVIYPKPLDCKRFAGSENPASGKSGIQNSAGIPGYENLISIKDYFPGDPWKFINWKATAKTSKLKVNEMEPEKSDAVILDLTMDHFDEIENILSCFAFVVLECSKKNIPIGLKTSSYYIEPSTGTVHKRKLLEMLATYDQN